MSKFLKLFVRDERGVSALEYAILAGLILTAVAAAVGVLSPSIKTAFQNLANSVTNATAAPAAGGTSGGGSN